MYKYMRGVISILHQEIGGYYSTRMVQLFWPDRIAIHRKHAFRITYMCMFVSKLSVISMIDARIVYSYIIYIHTYILLDMHI